MTQSANRVSSKKLYYVSLPLIPSFFLYFLTWFIIPSRVTHFSTGLIHLLLFILILLFIIILLSFYIFKRHWSPFKLTGDEKQ